MDATVFCESARANHKRFVFPATRDIKLDPGAYQVRSAVVLDRAPAWDFSERPRHESKKRQVDEFLNSQELSATASTWSAFSSLSRPSTGLEQMSVASARPDLAKISKINMTEAPLHYRDWCEMDLHSSKVPRRLSADFRRMQGRKTQDAQDCQYFEPGKYAVSYDAVESPVKTGVPFANFMGRAQSAASLRCPLVEAGLTDKAEVTKPDRSLHRGCLQTAPRKTHLTDFSKELARPPLLGAAQVFYDEDDPEVSLEVLKHELSFDASIADHAVIPRHDMALAMATSLERQRAVRASRLFQGDRGQREAAGLGLPECRGAMESSIEACKESPSRPRADVGVSFNRVQGRQRTRIHGEYSPLRKPRGMVAPDFSRSAPHPGFASRINVGRLRGRQKYGSSEVPKHWPAEQRDEAENEPPP